MSESITALAARPAHTRHGNTRYPGVVAILPRGEAYRNFVYSGALDRVNAEVGVGVLAVIPNRRLEQALRQRYVAVWELEEIPERWPVRFTREILDIAHGRWLWSEAAKERWRRRELEIETMGQRLKRWGKKALATPFATSKGLSVLSRVERSASRLLRTTDDYVRLFQTTDPQLVFNASHVHSAVAIQAVQAAQWLGIPTAAFVFSWDNLTSQGRILTPYDHYLVWNESLRDQLLRVYPFVRPEQVIVTGTPQFDFHFREEFWLSREAFCTQVGADPARPIVLYSTGMPNHMPGEPEVVEDIADMLKTPELSNAQLLVRIYPKDRTDRFRELRQRRPDILFPEIPWERNWLTPLPEDAVLLTNMLRHAAVGINVASTVSLELCMFDKPVINVAYNPRGVPERTIAYSRYYEFDHYRTVVASGAVDVVRNPQDLPASIAKALHHPAAAQQARRWLIHEIFGDRLDGRCAERVARALLRLTAPRQNQDGY